MFNFQKNNRLNVRALLKRNTHHVYVYVVVSARAHSKCETCVQVMPYLIHRSENHFNLNRKNKIRQQAIKKATQNAHSHRKSNAILASV